MNKLKKKDSKQKDPTKGQLTNVASTSQALKEGNESSLQNIKEYWEEEVSGLIGAEFSSTEEALDGIITKVLDRIQSKGREREELKGFLKDTLETDPELMDRIGNLLK